MYFLYINVWVFETCKCIKERKLSGGFSLLRQAFFEKGQEIWILGCMDQVYHNVHSQFECQIEMKFGMKMKF